MRGTPRSIRCALALIASLGVLSGVGCGSSDDGGGGSSAPGVTDDTVQLGATSFLTGAAAASCQTMRDGQQAWFDKVNADGGVNGRQIEYNVLDDGGDPTQAIDNARRLITEDKVFALAGGCGTAGTDAILPVVDSSQTPFISGLAQSTKIILPEPHKTAFTLNPPNYMQAAALLEWAIAEHGPGNIGVLYIDGLDPELVPTIERIAKESGSKLVADVPVDVAKTDFGPEVISVRDADPDYMILAGTTGQAAGFVRQAGQQGYSPKKLYLGTVSASDPLFIKGAGKASYGKTMAVYVADVNAPGVKECQDAMPAGTEINLYGVFGCAVGKLVVKALEDGGEDLTRESYLEAIEKLDNFETGVSVPISFSPSHLLVKDLILFSVSDAGKLETVDTIPVPEESLPGGGE